MEKGIVSNASSLIFLAKLDVLKLAKNMFSRIFIPKEVLDEIFEKNKAENSLIQREVGGFLVVNAVQNVKDFPIYVGERAAISLCLEKNIKKFLSDDKRARNYARNLDIEVIGVLGILLWNLQANKINKKECLDLVNKLIEKGYYMSSDLYSELLTLINSTEN